MSDPNRYTSCAYNVMEASQAMQAMLAINPDYLNPEKYQPRGYADMNKIYNPETWDLRLECSEKNQTEIYTMTRTEQINENGKKKYVYVQTDYKKYGGV